MSRVLIIAEHSAGNLNPATAKCVACASDLGADAIDIVVLADVSSGVADAAAMLAGVSKVLTVERAENAAPLAAILAPQIAEIATAYDYVFGPSTTFGKDVTPRVAALLGVNQLSDIMQVVDARTFKRPIYAGNAITTVSVKPDYKVVGTVRAASYKAVGEQSAASIEAITTSAEIPTETSFVGVQSGASDRPDFRCCL